MWYKIQNQNIELRIFVKPNAKRTAFISITQEELHIALHAKPHQGEANSELFSYLSKSLKIPRSQIVLKRGEHSRHKLIILPLSDTILKQIFKLDQTLQD